MWTSLGNELRRPVPLTLAALAVAGWFLLVVYLIVMSSRENETQARIAELENSRTDLATRLEQREQAGGSLDALTAQVETVNGEIGTLQNRRSDLAQEVEAQSSELEQLRGSADALRQEMAAIQGTPDDAVAVAVAAISAAEDMVNGLSETAHRDALKAAKQEVAAAETRLQEARQAEAQLRQQAQTARQELRQLEEERTATSTAVGQLRDHRETLTTEVTRAEEQRAQLQEQVTELAATLAERSERVSGLEQHIAELQTAASEAAMATASGIYPGSYLGTSTEAPGILLDARFGDDGTFEIGRRSGGPGAVSGRYEVADGELVLSEASGATGDATFPMHCLVEPKVGGFALTSGVEGCPLGGFGFRRTD